MFIVPFTEHYPYQLNFTLRHVINLFQDDILINKYIQSLFVATATSIFGTIISFVELLLLYVLNYTESNSLKMISIITNSIPGMILGLSYLLFFQNSSIKGTFLIVILSIVVHYYTTPFLMAKSKIR